MSGRASPRVPLAAVATEGLMGSTAVVLLIIVIAAVLVYRARNKKP